MLAPLLLAALFLLIVVTSLLGPAHFTTLRFPGFYGVDPGSWWGAGDPADLPMPAKSQASWPRVLMLVVFCVAITTVTAWLIRALSRGEAAHDETAPPTAPLDRDTEFQVVRTTVQEAAAVVERPAPAAEVSDLVIRCWLVLETGSARLGHQRKASQTATEFTQQLLADYATDPQALADLTKLYNRARFGHSTMTETERRQACQALAVIAETLKPREPINVHVETSHTELIDEQQSPAWDDLVFADFPQDHHHVLPPVLGRTQAKGAGGRS